MGAASREQVADSQTGTINSATISGLRSSMAIGNIVTASDINTLIGMFNTMVGHYHTYTDRYQQATFGNNGDRGLYEEAKNTGAPITSAAGIAIPTILTVTNSTVIAAAKHNEIAFASRALQTHLHEINDRVA